MSLSDRIEVHYINIDRRTNAISRDVYIIDDAAVDGDKLTFSWLISGNATADTSAYHTFSISSTVVPIVKIPAKYIDKDTSGYIVLHRSYTMTEEDVQNYINAYFEGRVCFIMWMDLCITA